MTHMQIEYVGQLRCKATHEDSGTEMITDAPKDNNGQGRSFSPTDLVGTALGACMATVMGIVAERHGIDLTGMKIEVEKQMSATPPRRISKLVVQLQMPLPPDHPKRTLLENTAHTCPVHQSLHPEVEQDIRFIWQGVTSELSSKS